MVDKKCTAEPKRECDVRQLAEADEALIALYEQQSAPAEPGAEENTETAAEALGEEETA